MSSSPIQVAEAVTDVSLGGGHMLYLTEEGQVYALGNNEKGQLGNDSLENLSEAVSWLIVRTLKGKPEKKEKPKKAETETEEKLSDRELIRLAKDMAKQQKAAAEAEESSVPEPADEKAEPAEKPAEEPDGKEIDVESLEDAITKDEE